MTKTAFEELVLATHGMSLPVMLALLSRLRERLAEDQSLQEAADHIDQAIEVLLDSGAEDPALATSRLQ